MKATRIRWKPTTGTRCPTLFDKWHGIFYMPSCTDTAGHTKAFIYPVMDHWRGGGVKVLRDEADSNRRPVGPQLNTPTTRPRWPPQVGESNITRVLNGGGGVFSLMGASSAITAPPRVGHPHGASQRSKSSKTCKERNLQLLKCHRFRLRFRS